MSLCDRMTGVGGRPEVIIEGSNAIDRGWKEYNFLYKPGAISEKLAVVGELLLSFCYWIYHHLVIE